MITPEAGDDRVALARPDASSLEVRTGRSRSASAGGSRRKAPTRGRAPDDNRWNLHSIGICLVGDFTTAPPSPRQMDALVRLVRSLLAEYGIPPESVVPHNFVLATECPGARFPWAQFMSRIR